MSQLAEGKTAIAGLVAGILHAVDGASTAAAVRAGGRAGLAIAGVFLAAAGVAAATWGCIPRGERLPDRGRGGVAHPRTSPAIHGPARPRRGLGRRPLSPDVRDACALDVASYGLNRAAAGRYISAPYLSELDIPRS